MTQRQSPFSSRNLGAAIQAEATLSNLLAQHRRSHQCFAKIAPLLPGPLRSQVRPGPINGEEWTLLVSNNAASAKLRQWQPDLEAALRQHDATLKTIKLKISPVNAG